MSVDAAILIRPEIRTVDGVAIRDARRERDSRQGSDSLRLSLWPEGLHAFDPTWRRLAKHTSLVADDLPGFGRFEHRDALTPPKATAAEGYAAECASWLEQRH
jgi:hypothetical protein